MKDRILQMLKTTHDYISGQELCDTFSVSRTAVWKAIHSLEEAGYQIEAVRNRGYRLVASPDVLFSDEIKSELHTAWLGQEILYLDTVDSTNNACKRRGEDGAKEGLLVISEAQSAGRGRRGRSWESPAGTGIWMSFLLRPDIDPGKASMLTLVAALAVQKAIAKETGLNAQIKWPNDLVLTGKKCTGILTEMSAEMNMINHVVIGIGINANMESFPEEIASMATSLRLESGQKINRARLVAGILEAFEECYGIFLQEGNLSGLKEAYEACLVNIDQPVRIQGNGGETQGTAHGINVLGELLVTDTEGNEIEVRAGEVSVRGLYSYC